MGFQRNDGVACTIDVCNIHYWDRESKHFPCGGREQTIMLECNKNLKNVQNSEYVISIFGILIHKSNSHLHSDTMTAGVCKRSVNRIIT